MFLLYDKLATGEEPTKKFDNPTEASHIFQTGYTAAVTETADYPTERDFYYGMAQILPDNLYLEIIRITIIPVYPE